MRTVVGRKGNGGREKVRFVFVLLLVRSEIEKASISLGNTWRVCGQSTDKADPAPIERWRLSQEPAAPTQLFLIWGHTCCILPWLTTGRRPRKLILGGRHALVGAMNWLTIPDIVFRALVTLGAASRKNERVPIPRQGSQTLNREFTHFQAFIAGNCPRLRGRGRPQTVAPSSPRALRPEVGL